MDGLIPMAFKAMLKNRTRRRYECLSSSKDTTSKESSYEEYDFFPSSIKSDPSVVSRPSTTFEHHMEMTNGGSQNRHHRRGWSVGDFSSMSYREGRSSGEDIGCSPSRRSQLVRNRSHRLFSCVSGE